METRICDFSGHQVEQCEYTFSECITLANLFMHEAFAGNNESTARASKWFIKAETAREEGTVQAQAYYRQNYL